MNCDIVSLKKKLLVKYPFFGRVITNVEFIENTNIETAGTDGKQVHYNPNFLNGLNSVSKKVFLLAHEVCHIAFDHINRSEGKDPEIWNIATDAVINQFLLRDGLEMIEGGVDIKEAINLDAEEMYEKLLKERKQQEKDLKGHDTHDMWGKAIENNKNKEKSKSKKNILERIFKKNKLDESTELEKAQEEIKKMGEKKAFEENKNHKRKNLEKLKENNAKASISSSKISEGKKINVENVGKSSSIIDWRYILKEAINVEVDWSYENLLMENGVVVPSLDEKPIPETEIVLDTSGSISEELLRNFLRETKNILGYSRIKAGCFDVEFYGFQEIRSEEDIDNMEFVGGGGTNFNAAIHAFSKRVENKIIFTDGQSKMPMEPIDAIWIVFGDKKIKPVVGRVIYITDEQLEDLYSNRMRR